VVAGHSKNSLHNITQLSIILHTFVVPELYLCCTKKGQTMLATYKFVFNRKSQRLKIEGNTDKIKEDLILIRASILSKVSLPEIQ
jgi:hypothetical protein